MRPASGFTLFILFFLFAISACEKTIHPGIKTTVTGRVFDPNKQKPVAGVQIEISESRRDGLFAPYGTYYKIIDSAITDSDGKYEIEFVTTGRGNEYHARIKTAVNLYASPTGPHQLNVGEPVVADFVAFELHTLKAFLHVTNNPKPPLRVFGGYGPTAQVYSRNADTTVFLKVMPNQVNFFQFNISNPDSSQYYNVRSDTINFPGFADTFSMSFQLDPGTFPRR